MIYGIGALTGLAGICVGLRLSAADLGSVRMTPSNGGFRVTTPSYTATVSADGCLTSLKASETIKARQKGT